MIPKGMGEMADTCAQCGTLLAPGGAGPAGLCPRCLLGFLLTLPSESPAEVSGGALVGKEIGNYRVLGVLGVGGMGIVYRARQKGLEREVALKVIASGALASGEEVERFLREARAAAKLRHPNIVPVHEVAVHEGVHFFTMDLIDGMTLAEASRGPDFPPRRALDLLRKAARAVHHAHENGVLHRDLKPSNIMLDRGGEPFIMDFGLARDLTAAGLTQSRSVMGTPAYMAPEQALGRVDEIGPRTDVYGLGAVLYECLTGRPPFDGRNAAEVLARAAREEPLPPRRRNPRIQREIETICLKALERDPRQRYPSASALADDIDRYLAGQTIHARRAGPAYRAWKFAMRHRAATAVAAVAVIAVAAWMLGPAWIDVAGEPAGAEIRLDGRPTGRSVPARLALFPARKVRVGLRAEGHEEAVATVRPASWRTERVDLRAVKDHGWLVCDVEPRDAAIRLERVGGAGASARSGERAKLPTGVWTIRIERDAYAPEMDVLAVAPGQEVHIRKALSPVMGALRVTSSVEGARMRVVPVDVPAGGEPREYVIPLEEGLPVPAGRYRLEFGMRNHFGRATEVAVPRGGTVSANATLAPQEMWKFDAGGNLGGRPAVADLDGDGDLEVVFSTSKETLYAVTAFGEVLWEFHARVFFNCVPVIADLDGDLLPDVVVGTRGPFVYALRGRDGAVLWRFEAAEMAPSVAAGDLDGDSVADIVVGSLDDHVYALAGRTGAVLWRFQTGGDVDAPAAVGDVNGDSWPDVVIPSRDEILYALSGRDGSLLWRYELGEGMMCAPALADLDGDSVVDVVASRRGPSYDLGQVALRGLDGGVLWEDSHAGHGVTTPAIADVNGDGVPDVLTGADHFYALSGRDGTQLWKRELLNAQGSAPALADLDGDSVQDVVVGSYDWNLHALSGRDGSVIWSFQTANYVGSPAVADFDGDSSLDVVVGSSDGSLYVVRGTAPPVRWTFRAGGRTILLCPDAADLNADEVPDVLAGATRGKLYALSGCDGSPLWTWGNPGEVTGTPVLADLNHDSVQDVVLRNTILLQRLSGRNGEPLEDWSLPWQDLIGESGFHAPELVDLNGDSVLDYVMDTYESHVQARNGADGSLLWRAATAHEHKAAPAIARLDDDDVPDVLVASDDSNVYALSGRDGSLLWRFATGGDASSRPALTDLNGDSTPDAVVGSKDGYLYALSGRDGSLLWRSETGFRYWETYGVAADLNADATPDVVASSYDWRVLAVSGRDGSPLWSFRLPDRTYMPPLLFEVDGNSVPDMVVGTLAGFLYALSGSDGSLIGRTAVGRPAHAMAAADLDGDSAPELLLGLRDGTVSALDGRLGAIFGAASCGSLRRARWNWSHDAFAGVIRETDAGLQAADDPATRALLLFVRARARIRIADLAGALEDIHAAHECGLRSPASAALRMLLDIRLGRETDSSWAAEALMEGAPTFLATLVDSPDLLASVEPAAYRAALERTLAALPEPAGQGLPGAALLLLLGRHEALLAALNADRMLASADLTTLAYAATLRSLASLLAGDAEQAARLRAVAATTAPGRAFLQIWPKTADDLERLLRID